MNLEYTEFNNNGFGITFKINKTIFKSNSPFQKIDIVETEGMGKLLLMDGLVMTTEKDEHFYHEMITHIPLISHKNPENVLVIGGGDGGSVREVLKHPEVQNVEMCEIDGLAIDVCKKYLPTIASQLDNPKAKIFVEDGVEFIKDKKSQYDVIIIDSTDPLGPGVGLFTEDFYNNVKSALKPEGIMVAQSESPIADKTEMNAMYTLLQKVFPIVLPYVGPVPTYPGGYWSWAFCSNNVNPFDNIDLNRVDYIQKMCKIYNADIHRGSFAVPNFVKDLVNGTICKCHWEK